MAVTKAQVGTRTVWEIDPAHTLVEFSARHMMVATVKGRFTGVSGTIVADELDPARSSVEIEIDTASIDTRNEQRDGHLRSADFLDAEQYPKITFKSTRVERQAEDRLRVVGDLTVRGTASEVVLDTTINGQGLNPWGMTVAGFSAETTINRHDFGASWNVPLEAGGVLVGEKVKIVIEVEAVKKA